MKRNKHLSKTFTLQKDQADCGIGCLLSLIRYYGGNATVESLREKSGTSKQGTTLLGLYQAANSIGFDAEGCEADIKALVEHGEPVILHVIMDEKYEHYVVCYYYENNKFCIGDPARGIIYWSKEELEQYWRTKTCLTLKPNTDFIKTEYTNKAKKEWLFNLLKKDQEAIYTIIVLGVVLTLLGMSMSIFSQKLIDDILPQRKLKVLMLSIAFLGFLLFARVAIQALRDLYIVKQNKSFNERINYSFFSSLLYLPKMFFDTRKIGDFVARLNDTQRIQNVIKQLITATTVDILSVFISLGFLFFYSWKLAVICLILSPIIFYIIFSFNKRIIESQQEVMHAYSQNEANYIDSIRGIEVIKNFSKQDIFLKRNQNIFGLFQSKIYELGRLNLRISLTSGLVLVVFLLLILAFSSYHVLNNNIKIGELMAIIGISSSLLASITNLALVSIPIQEAKVAFDRMFEYSSIKPEAIDGIALDQINSINIQGIDFRYNGRSKLLEDVSLVLEKGKITTLLGESGNGKTTLAEILQKNYKPEVGNIIINGEYNLEEISLSSWRYLIGIVPQNIQLFNGSVAQNIVLDEQINEERLNSLVTDFGFAKFISSLPQGWGTLVGEEGINLSGGQKQLLGWMRALYHNPEFLILDEPTSSLDKETRSFIYSLISKLKSKKVIFIISHYIEDLHNISDNIIVLRDKTIKSLNESEISA
ncbi:peptidase domain-containing ABC transporter [Elizabethkingia anophelis]|uniref:peptidase domain-containing ABC transporter n=1 Tax=Elizabethkingia TaxID=308865 RepID=UPI0009956B15|nr:MULTISPECIES: peptidase domain-containing ABC transporter [Elizabethkingia]AQW97705.1 peptidase C39 [Elizabethkingia anophelis]MCT4172059.1 peptidase domain-containing ABC transporter [Elizabethkingia anophelis]MCT4175081.1 peptidase domain-containing ABC transporter [Elizabethkingia anophelis]MCT4204974.1 peptidase domain-containing ABC transporter [Elizabethkingia anophelis]MCT4208488.1 peptidase domain-containing ABC transporter [Elizabethkingia anophelis]